MTTALQPDQSTPNTVGAGRHEPQGDDTDDRYCGAACSRTWTGSCRGWAGRTSGTGAIDDVKVIILLQEAVPALPGDHRHCKAIAAWGDGADLLATAGVDASAPGVVVSEKASASQRKGPIKAMGMHREWERVLRLGR